MGFVSTFFLSFYPLFSLLLRDGLTDGVHLEANLAQLSVRQDVASVEDEGGLGHGVIDSLEV